MRRPVFVLAFTAAIIFGLGASAISANVRKLSQAQTDYLTQCGGCHGVTGVSAPSNVPTLRGRVGYFLCLQAGRDYLVGLPNVALAPLDDRRLANVMNYVAFTLGNAKHSDGAFPFTPGEVRRARERTLAIARPVAARAAIVEEISIRCGVPAETLSFRP